MGNCAEATAEKHNISREEQDSHAIETYKRAAKAWKEGAFEKEVAPVTIKGKKGDTIVKEDEEYQPLGTEATYPSAAIPEFWLTALRNHVGLSEIITDRDADALKHLVDIRLEYLPTTDPKPGFKLIFVFTPNEFFENEVLEKTYLYQEEVGYTGDFMYDHAIGTEIKWKEDKDLTKEFEIKKQRNKSE